MVCIWVLLDSGPKKTQQHIISSTNDGNYSSSKIAVLKKNKEDEKLSCADNVNTEMPMDDLKHKDFSPKKHESKSKFHKVDGYENNTKKQDITENQTEKVNLCESEETNKNYSKGSQHKYQEAKVESSVKDKHDIGKTFATPT